MVELMYIKSGSPGDGLGRVVQGKGGRVGVGRGGKMVAEVGTYMC